MTQRLSSFEKTPRVQSLRELCIDVLIDNKHALEDVGDVPSAHLIPVLSHCTPEELQRIEDKTWERSGRDIRWNTWRMWKRIYVSKYGKPNPDEVPRLVAMSDEAIDPDNLPEGLGDYRTLYECKEWKREAQKRRLAQKLRKIKRKEQLAKENKKSKRVGSSINKSRSQPSLMNPKTTHPYTRERVSCQDFFLKMGVPRSSAAFFKGRR